MSSNTTHPSETRRNRFSLNLFAALLTLALFAFTAARPASAETCEGAFANWSSSSYLVHSVTSSSTSAQDIDEWDSDVVKIRHTIAGLLVLGAKGAAISGTLYVWNTGNNEADVVGTTTLAGGSGDIFTTEVEAGDYCFEITDYDSSVGEYVLNVNFLDGCTLGTLMPNACGGE